MKILSLDFETYYSEEYTLKKMTTEEYIRDPRFKVHMLGVVNEKGQALVIPAKDVASFLSRVDWSTTAILCHHTHFDGLILSHHYGVRPKLWLDTLSMARIVHRHGKSHSLGALAELYKFPEKNVPYNLFRGVQDLSPSVYAEVAAGCAHDAQLNSMLFRELVKQVPREELRVIDITTRLFTEPVLNLDSERMQSYLTKLSAQKADTLARLNVDKATLSSSDKFAELLRSLGTEPPLKPKKPTKTNPNVEGQFVYAFAKTDDGMKELLEHDNIAVQALASARLGVKSTLLETRCQRMLDMATRGAMCVYLKHAGAHTLRWSGGDKMNWQNLTRGSELRKCIKAPPGYVLVVADSSQIECRMLNVFAGQEDVLEAFREGRDIYSENATRFYGRTVTRADKLERHLGKTIELGCGFQMGWRKFQETCRKGALGGPPVILSDDEAKYAVKLYRDTHPSVVNAWKEAESVLHSIFKGADRYTWSNMVTVDGKRIYGPDGTYLDYDNLSFDGDGFFIPTRKGKSNMYGGKTIENVVQWLARVYIAEAALRIQTRYRIVMTSHDEVVGLAPANEADAALEFMLTELKRPPLWCPTIPLDAEGGYDVCYSK